MENTNPTFSSKNISRTIIPLYIHCNVLVSLRFQRVFESGSGLQIQTSEEIPATRNDSNGLASPSIQPRSWASMFGMFRSQTSNGEDVEAQICRPIQNHSTPPQTQRRQVQVGDTTKIFIERNQFLINGKPINSLDGMRQTLTHCPESYLNFMKAVGSAGQNFTNGVSYPDFRSGYSLYAYDLSGSGITHTFSSLWFTKNVTT